MTTNEEYMEGIRAHRAEQRAHKARICWIPALKDHRLICVACGETLAEDINGLEFTFGKNCQPEDNALGVHIVEQIGIKDRFGGV